MSNVMTAPSLASSQFSVTSRRRLAPAPRASSCTLSDSGGAQAQALSAMAALSTACSNAITLVNQNPLGRYANSGSCSYDCGFMEQDWNWWADYRPTNANLAQRLSAMNIAASYGVAFQPTQNWLNQGLPGYANQLSGNLATINGIDAVIAATGSETPEQSAQLSSAFTALGNALQNNLNEANQGLQSLAGFLSWEQGSTSGFPSFVEGCKTFIQQNATATENNLIGQIACGADDVRNTYNAMFADIAAKFARMQPGFNDTGNRLQSALQAGDAVTGVFLVLQSNSQLVSGQLAQAQLYPAGSVLRTMHLSIVQNEWGSFVQQANSQLSAG
ncbi:MAG: hypothetical protein ABWY06_03970 [Pseudomonas sp.]|uniref:hypothetical protein n=1 Tax=Pseudomonas sp. TaxID=306 RepID=UPI00339A21AB